MATAAAVSQPAAWDPLAVPLELPRRRYGYRDRLQSLSPASVRAYEKCPEAFRRRYLLGEKVQANFRMTLGSVVGDALNHYFAGKMNGRAPGAQEVDDRVLELFEAKIAEAALSVDDDPDLGRAQCRAGVAAYLSELAPRLEPISIERRASFHFGEAVWRFVCYFDLEFAAELADVKFGEFWVKEVRADRDLQATTQIYMRWAEGKPADFVFHSGLLEAPEGSPRWSIVPAKRSFAQLRGFERRVAQVARQIVHLDATEPGEWPLSSDLGWWCAPPDGGQGCPYWESCPVGEAGA